MGALGRYADDQLLGNLGIVQAIDHEPKYLALSRRQVVTWLGSLSGSAACLDPCF